MAINSYATLTELKLRLPEGATYSATLDSLLTALLETISREIDRSLKWEPGAFYVDEDVVRYISGSGSERLLIPEMAAEPTSVEVAESGDLSSLTSWDSTDYFVYPDNAIAMGQYIWALDVDTLNGTKSVWYAYRKSVKITGKFGFSVSPPDAIKEATILEAVRMYKWSTQGYQDKGANSKTRQLQYDGKISDRAAKLIMDYSRLVF